MSTIVNDWEKTNLESLHLPSKTLEGLRRLLVVNDSAPSSHPLSIASAERTRAAHGIAMLHLALQNVRDGLESAMRVPRRPNCFARAVGDRAEVIQHQERVNLA
jgi:hypothetical protein